MFSNEEEFERLVGSLRFDDEPDHAHRDKLEEKLLRALRKESKRSIWQAITATTRTKVAAACVAAMVLAATGWGAEKAYQAFFGRIIDESEIVVVTPTTKVTRPDGSTIWMGGVMSHSVGLDEETERKLEQAKPLIEKKKYEFVEALDVKGEKQYAYKFALADGEQFVHNFICPLEEVDSWEEYRQRQQEHLERDKERFRWREEAVREAIAAGRVRLVEVKEIVIHICKNTDSGEKIRVQRVVSRGGKEIARISAYPRDMSIGSRSHSTSWEDHLRAIESGDRELIEEKLHKLYMCEATLSDGATARYGGGGPPVPAQE